ncbi:MAG TPA: hydrogenase expression/formation protein HypE [bacterium]
MYDKITLGHGSGGSLTGRLIRKTILKVFRDPVLRRLEDSAAVLIRNETRTGKLRGMKIAFTTDSYVIDPIFFPGGDIGKLAVCGTVNDLAMKGAVPRYISLSLIIEEGLAFVDLEKILRSAAATARQAGVAVVCGDTKVVDKGKADKIFINTSGIGFVKVTLGREKIKAGDKILINGTIGDHGIAVMNARLKLGLRSRMASDTAPLNLITKRLFDSKAGPHIHFMRDPTRGGVVSVLHEALEGSGFGIKLDESCLPISPEVHGACEILGLDPLYVANEGKFLMFIDPRYAGLALKVMQRHVFGKKAAMIGEVVSQPRGVWLHTNIGGTRPLLQLETEGLPRIC